MYIETKTLPPGKGRVEELNLPDCTSQEVHQISFQLTRDTELSTPPLQLSYRTVETAGTPYSEVNLQAALDLLYNYQLEVDRGNVSGLQGLLNK